VLVELPPRARPDAPPAARARLGAWLVALIALLPHLRGLGNGFVYDDFRFVAENPGIQTLERPAELVASVERMSRPLDRDIWRPLRTLLFALQWRLFSGHAAGFHAVSLLLHLLLVRGVVALAQRLPGLERVHAWAAGLLFGLHPVTVESVAWISSQGDLLAGGLVVGSLLAAARRPLLALGLAALALLAKESALPLCAVVFLAARWWRDDARPRTRLAFAIAVATLLYVVARQHVLGRDFGFGASGLGQRDAPLSERLHQGLQSSAVALRLFVWPRPLAIAYDDGFLPPARSLGFLDVALALAKLAVVGARSGSGRASRSPSPRSSSSRPAVWSRR
jgi:hypothetical protein